MYNKTTDNTGWLAALSMRNDIFEINNCEFDIGVGTHNIHNSQYFVNVNETFVRNRSRLSSVTGTK